MVSMASSRFRLRFLSLLANRRLRLGTTRLMNSSPSSILHRILQTGHASYERLPHLGGRHYTTKWLRPRKGLTTRCNPPDALSEEIKVLLSPIHYKV